MIQFISNTLKGRERHNCPIAYDEKHSLSLLIFFNVRKKRKGQAAKNNDYTFIIKKVNNTTKIEI